MRAWLSECNLVVVQKNPIQHIDSRRQRVNEELSKDIHEKAIFASVFSGTTSQRLP